MKNLRGQASFEDQTEVHCPVVHSLVDKRVTTSLGNDQIGPLDNNNGDEIGGLTSVFKDFAVLIGLKIIVLKFLFLQFIAKLGLILKLHYLTQKSIQLKTHPFLSIRIQKIIDSKTVPFGTQLPQTGWHETVVGHDPEVA